MESPNLKIVFIKKFREHLDVSMQTAIEYYNRYDADFSLGWSSRPIQDSFHSILNDFKVHK